MSQYLIIAYDYTDNKALERRMEARPKHFEEVKRLKASGNFLTGGAILNGEGRMIGSSLIMQFDNDDELARWLENEPYIVLKVWEKVEVKPFMVAAV